MTSRPGDGGSRSGPDRGSGTTPPPPAPAHATGGSSAPSSPAPIPGTDWRKLHLWQIQPVRDVLFLLALVVIVQVGYALRSVTVPMLLALALAYLFEPLVQRATRWKWMNRPLAAGIIILTASVVIVVPVAVGTLVGLAQGVRYAGNVAERVELLGRGIADPANPQVSAELGPRWRSLRDSLIRVRADAAAIRARVDQAAREREERERLEREHSPPSDPSASPTTPPIIRPADEPVAPSTADRPGSPAPGVADDVHDPDAESSAAGPEPDAEHISLREQLILWLDSGRQWVQDGSLVTQVETWIESNGAGLARRTIEGGAGAATTVVRVLSTFGFAVFSGLLTAFFFFFFCTGFGRIVEFWKEFLPLAQKDRVIDLVQRMDRVIAGFVRGRLLITGIEMGFYAGAYAIIGVPAPLLIGPLVGAMYIVPFLALLGIPIAILAMLLEPPGPLWQQSVLWILLAPCAVHAVGQALDDYVLTPKIQGKNTDMSMPTILFVSLSGGILAGVYGLLVAIPVAACLKIVMKEVFWPRFRAWAEGRARDPLPISRG